MPPLLTVTVSASSMVMVVPATVQDNAPPDSTVIPPLKVVFPLSGSVPSVMVTRPAKVKVPLWLKVTVPEDLFIVSAPRVGPDVEAVIV